MDLNNPIVMYGTLGVAFCTILLILYGIQQAIKSARQRRKIIQKIKHNRDAWTISDLGAEEKHRAASGKVLKMVARMGSRFSADNPSTYSAERLRLLRAGIRSPNAGQILWGAKIWSPLMLIMVFLGLRIYLPQLKILSSPTTISITVAIGVFGFYLPELWLSMKSRLRKDKLVKDLPDTLDLLVVCVEAGLGLDSAFNRVAEEIKLTSPHLSREFKLLNLELRAGKSRREALRNLSTRADIDSLKALATLLIQTEMFGTGITKALRVFSDSFRTHRFQKAEEIAAKLPVKMLIPMIFFIFPTFMAVMIGPAAISIWENWLSK
jgi:tight adherence protein C